MDKIQIMNRIKTLKGIPKTDEVQNELITEIIDITEQSLLSHLGDSVTSVPESMEFIMVEVGVRRYNRLGAEGAVKKTVEGMSLEFDDRDFEPYQHLFTDNTGGATEGEVIFY